MTSEYHSGMQAGLISFGASEAQNIGVIDLANPGHAAGIIDFFEKIIPAVKQIQVAVNGKPDTLITLIHGAWDIRIARLVTA
ncbi:hypothetical protein [Pararhizobium sp.]|uniref:hypothetical protein n=1 Tax=Pararhizobium sp. TaxID=1977563 RepID=UPI003D1171A6